MIRSNGLLWMIVLVAAALAAVGCSSSRSFSTPQAGVTQLVQALESMDRAAVSEVLGEDSRQLLGSGDKTADRADIQRFLALYREHHELVPAEAGTMTLLVGRDQWPMPI